jgi:molybdate transport system substrate-binding protein
LNFQGGLKRFAGNLKTDGCRKNCIKFWRSFEMKRIHFVLKSVMLFSLLMIATPLQAGELRISVAASMTDLFKDLISSFGKNNPEVVILPNFGPSGGLAKQINQGAPADLYVSANPKWMKYLVEQQKIAVSTKKTFAHNSLVFIGRPNNGISALTDLPGLERIGIGSPKSVPAGQYAQQALAKTGLYASLLQAGKLVMAKDVRQALIYADRGETDGSFVYKTDALLARSAKILFEVNQELYERVTCPVAITVMGADNQDAKDFYNFVTSESAKEIITQYGFSLPD